MINFFKIAIILQELIFHQNQERILSNQTEFMNWRNIVVFGASGFFSALLIRQILQVWNSMLKKYPENNFQLVNNLRLNIKKYLEEKFKVQGDTISELVNSTKLTIMIKRKINMFGKEIEFFVRNNGQPFNRNFFIEMYEEILVMLEEFEEK